MKELDFNASFSEPLTVALGFFDCVHRGHRQILRETVALAAKNHTLPAVFTFRRVLLERGRQDGRLSAQSERRDGHAPEGSDRARLAISFRDRISVFESLGIKVVIAVDFAAAFASQSPKKFLSLFDNRFVLEGMVCGEDYRFGKGAKGTAETLKKFCSARKMDFSSVQLLEAEGAKISSTELRNLLRAGDFERLNSLLGSTFFRTGKVVEGFAKGREIGIRTANVDFGEGLCELGDGVFRTRTLIDGRMLPSATFVGTSATFGRTQKTIECHVIGLDEDLYGKQLRIFFERKLRENRKFDGFESLVAQIRRDIDDCR